MKRARSNTPVPESDVYPRALPPRFAPRLIGHDRAQAALLEAYQQDRLEQAWLICGQEGIGKATLAWRFARFLFSRERDRLHNLNDLPDEPSAHQLAALSHPDCVFVRRAWNEEREGFFNDIRVEDVRDAQNRLRLCPSSGGVRVMIIDAADDLNRASANAALKMIEEPPPQTMTLIIAHQPRRLPATLRSRCRHLHLNPLETESIAQIVKAQGSPWSDASPEALNKACAGAKGSARQALWILDSENTDLAQCVDGVIRLFPHVDWRQALRLSEYFANTSKGLAAYAHFVSALYDALHDYAKRLQDPRRLEILARLWDRLRLSIRETETWNGDRKLQSLALFQMIAETAALLAPDRDSPSFSPKK